MGLREKASGLKKVLPAVFLTLKDNETPIMAKVLAGVTVGYALSPIDLIHIRYLSFTKAIIPGQC